MSQTNKSDFKTTVKALLGTREFYTKVLAIAFPIALQSLITIGVNMVDTIMLGTLGEVALSSSALANQFISIYHICCMGIGMGASVMVSRFYGMNDMHSLKKTITIMLRFCIGFGLIFTLATAFFPSAIMRIYTPEKEVIEGGTSYFIWSIPTYLLLGLSLDISLALRSIGKAKVPLVCSIISFTSNIFFNWVFIFGKLGAPRMEIAGAALGTLIARAIECTAILVYFLKIEKRIQYRIRDLFMKVKDLVPEYVKISLPVLISDAMMALGNSVIAIIMGHIGSAFVSANSITTVTQQLTTVLTQGISQAGCIVTGHTLGRGDVEQAQRDGYTFITFGFLLGLAACVIILIIAEPIVGMYNITEDTHKIAMQLMNGVAINVIFQSTNGILTKGVLRGGGDTRFLMVADVIFLWVASVPLGMLTGLVLHLPAFWIYLSMKVDQFIKCFWCIGRLRSRKWIKAIQGSKA